MKPYLSNKVLNSNKLILTEEKQLITKKLELNIILNTLFIHMT